MDFRELTLIFFANILGSTVILGLFAFIVKKWLGLAIDLRYKELDEKLKLKVDIDKTQALHFLGKQNTIYPELIEIVYRLRNLLRDIMDFFPKDKASWDNSVNLTKEKVLKYKNNLEQFDKLVFVLTDNLYKYKAFLDNDTFEELHLYKRKMQDAAVVMDGLSRTPDGRRMLYMESNFTEGDAIWNLFLVRLANIYEEVDTLHNKISNHIKIQLEKHVPK